MALQRVWHDFHSHNYLRELLFGICNEDFINLCFLYSIMYISISALFGVLQKSGNAFATKKSSKVKWKGRKGERWRRKETERGQSLRICRTCRCTAFVCTAFPNKDGWASLLCLPMTLSLSPPCQIEPCVSQAGSRHHIPSNAWSIILFITSSKRSAWHKINVRLVFRGKWVTFKVLGANGTQTKSVHHLFPQRVLLHFKYCYFDKIQRFYCSKW